jgi:hypothetical protein
MPGIIDASIRTKTAYGSLRDAKINFTCHNRRQLDVLDTLYMRPGMPILLEWGWDPYISNSGKRESYFPYLTEWFNSDSDINDINTIIHDRIKASGGNYDGFVGYVKNFEIKSRSDGGYDCTTELAAMGEVLEGLKGRSDGNVISVDNKEYETDNLEYYLKALRDYCEIIRGRELLIGSSLRIDTQLTKNLIKIQNHILPLITNKAYDSRVFRSILEKQSEDENLSHALNTRIDYFEELGNMEPTLDKYLLYKGEALGVNGDEKDNNTKSSFHYIKWELLVLIFNGLVFDTYQGGAKPTPITEISLIDEQQPTTGPKQPLKYSKFSFKNGESITFNRTAKGGNQEITTTFSDLMDMSVDPSVCLLPHQINSLKKDKTDSSYTDNFDINKTQNPRNISDIYINLDYLINEYERTKYKGDEVNEDFNLFTFIQTIWEKGINNACAGTHEFTIHTEKTRGNVVRIIDMHKSNVTPQKLYEFNIQGNNSIVRDFNYNTTIDSKLSSTVAIAAQAPDSISDLDAVSFAAFNRNIQFRFFREGTSDDKNVKDIQDKKRLKYESDLEGVEKQLGYLYDFKIDLLKGGFTDDKGKIESKNLSVAKARGIVKSLKSSVISLKSRYSKSFPDKDIFKGFRKRNNNPNQSTVIPLKFNAKIDGIGGLVIGNIFKINPLFLPKGYQEDDIAFAIMTENQTITAGQDWTTDFSGQMLLLDSKNLEEEEDILSFREDQSTITANEGKEIISGKREKISPLQQSIDPSLNNINEGDILYLKLNDEPTKIRTGTEVDNTWFIDNIIGHIPSGNKLIINGTTDNPIGLGEVITKTTKDKEYFTNESIAGNSLSDETKVYLGYEEVTIEGEDFIRIDKDKLTPYASQLHFIPLTDDGTKYTIPIGKKYYFEDEREVTWYYIEFNEATISKIEEGPLNKDKLNNGAGWMRIDTVQSSPDFNPNI